jgi:hypothetical protein
MIFVPPGWFLMENCLQISREGILIHKVMTKTVFTLLGDQMARA